MQHNRTPDCQVKFLALLANARLARQKLASNIHSSLFYPTVGEVRVRCIEKKKPFNNIETKSAAS